MMPAAKSMHKGTTGHTSQRDEGARQWLRGISDGQGSDADPENPDHNPVSVCPIIHCGWLHA